MVGGTVLLADLYGVLLLVVSVPVLRWAVAPSMAAFWIGRQVERLKHRRPQAG